MCLMRLSASDSKDLGLFYHLLSVGSNIRTKIAIYSGPSKVEHNPFQEAVRLSICSIFELNFLIRINLN